MSNGAFADVIRASGWAAPDRRLLLLHAASGSLAALLVHLGLQDASAQCGGNGRKCRRGNQCCSGICRGRRGRRKCRAAPGQSICAIEDVGVGGVPITPCNDGPDGCFCYRTTRGAAFCGSNSSTCAACSTDADCPRDGFVPGSRCIPVAVCPTGRACVRPCPNPA